MNAAKLELHYYFPDSSHSIDAIIRNKCEAELLGLFAETADVLGIKLKIESEALREGGLREFWKALGENNTQITILLTIIAILLSRSPVSSPEKEVLDLELTKLKTEEQKLQIKKLRQELNDPTPSQETTEDALKALNQNTKIVVRRSNFFKQLISYQKVQSITITPFNAEMEPLQDETRVMRKAFSSFILYTHTIKPIVIDDAIIEIISPVLKEGKYKWKGVFENELLNFSMLDREFIEQVLREEVTFQHGTFIECVLNINRKFDEVGEVIITGYSVSIVVRKFDDRQSIETKKGKSYKYAKRLQSNQNSLFEDE